MIARPSREWEPPSSPATGRPTAGGRAAREVIGTDGQGASGLKDGSRQADGESPMDSGCPEGRIARKSTNIVGLCQKVTILGSPGLPCPKS